jgi:membrane associated rhomboid family serine protease
VTDSARDTDDFCYRHPDRQSYILCQRCGRTVCAECQTQAAVGVHCPECVREARESAPRTRPAVVTRMRSSLRGSSGVPVVTYSLIGINVAAYLLQLVTGGLALQAFAYLATPGATVAEPWLMLTAAFLHSMSSPLHILFNMFSLYIFGPILEQAIGRARFLVLYLLAAFGGSVAVLLLNPGVVVVGASGAIFGLMGAFFVVQRRLGGNSAQLLIVIGLNLVIGFVVPGISWEGHVGGLVVGSGVAAIYLATRRRQQKPAQIAAVAGVAVLLLAITAVAVVL